MTSGELLRIAPDEDRACALRARLRRAARNEMPKQTRHRTCAFGTRAAGAPAETPRKMRSILGGSA
jgi:hypothetical protein